MTTIITKSPNKPQNKANLAPFLAACSRKSVGRIPVWYMRQAGRCLPEYRALKEKYDILTLCRTPELAAEVSLMPIRRFGVDAIILFADIMLPLIGMGVDLKIVESIGPVIDHPIREKKDLAGLRLLQNEADFDYLKKTIGILRGSQDGLAEPVPVIGFSGMPFTLASYMIEGKPSRDFKETKKLMYGQPDTWAKLMQILTDSIIFYLRLQIKAGIQAVQLFDSWVGCLSKEDYARYVLPYAKQIFIALGEKDSRELGNSEHAAFVPRIHFGTNTRAFLEEFASVDCEVVGVDWRSPLHEAWKEINKNGAKAIQGNLDPAILLCDFSVVKDKVDEIFSGLEQAGFNKKEGFIFNLGHGVLPDTPFETLVKLTDYVHSK